MLAAFSSTSCRLTLPQLVELSPFFSPSPERQHPLFVGQKQTTLVELNIQTGELGAVFGGRQAGVWCGAQRTTSMQA